MLSNNIKQDYSKNLNKLNAMMIIALEVKKKSFLFLIYKRTFSTERVSPGRKNS